MNYGSKKMDFAIRFIKSNLAYYGSNEQIIPNSKFWDHLKTAVEQDSQTIVFSGKLNAELSDDNPRGVITVQAKHIDHGYSLEMVDDNKTNLSDTMQVYWLPWKNGTAQTVSIEELDASACDYFMTSEMTGCRLSVTDQYISHIAYIQVNTSVTTTQEGRDSSELREINDKLTMPVDGVKRRRVLSISERQNSHTDLDKMTGSTRYQYNEKHGVVVFGYKENGEWKLKYFERSKGRDLPDGKWHELTVQESSEENSVKLKTNPNGWSFWWQ